MALKSEHARAIQELLNLLLMDIPAGAAVADAARRLLPPDARDRVFSLVALGKPGLGYGSRCPVATNNIGEAIEGLGAGS